MLSISNLNEVAKILGVKPEEVKEYKIEEAIDTFKIGSYEWKVLDKALIELDNGNSERIVKNAEEARKIYNEELKNKVAKLKNLDEIAKILGIKPKEVTKVEIEYAIDDFSPNDYEWEVLREALIELDGGRTAKFREDVKKGREEIIEECKKEETEEIAKEAYVKLETLRTKLMSDEKLFDKAKKITGLSKLDILSVKGFMNKNKKNIKRRDRRILEATLIRLSKEELSDEMKKKLRVPRLVNKVKRVVKKTLKFAFNSTVAFLGYLFLPEIPILKGVTNFVYILVP